MTVRILTGDCRDVLKALPDESVQCCITSPPYFGLRDYGIAEQIGLEAEPAAFVAELVAVFREVRRVLRDDGTLWLNLGDSYAGSGRGGNTGNDSSGIAGGQPDHSRVARRSRDIVSSAQRDNCPTARGSRLPAGLHESQRQSGAIGRAWTPPPHGLKQKDLIGIPWRVAFALQADGWWLRQDIIWSKPNPMPESVQDRCTKSHEYLFLLSKSSTYYCDMDAIAEPAVYAGDVKKTNGAAGMDDFGDGMRTRAGFARGVTVGETRNKRSVWTVTAQPFKEAHFATFPSALIEPCIKAGCPPGGVVLDPFGGAGTTGLVADGLQRDAVLIELNPAYVEIARRRIIGDSPLFSAVFSEAT